MYVKELPRPDYLRIGMQQVGRAIAKEELSVHLAGDRGCGHPVIGKCLSILVTI